MSYGFLATNNNNQILVSSDTKNLHFVGKFTNFTTIVSEIEYGGIQVVVYRITCKVIPVPFITAPNSQHKYAISRISKVNNTTWDIEVLKSGTADSFPEVYIFAEPSATVSSDTHGMVVYRDDGSVSFDSRLRPLAIINSLNVSQTSSPKGTVVGGLNGDGSSNASSTFLPDPTFVNTYTVSTGLPTKPMFFFASLAQSVLTSEAQRSERIFDILVLSKTRTYNSVYWAQYRGVIRLPNASTIEAGWAVTRHNVMTNQVVQTGGIFGSIGNLFGIFSTYNSSNGAPPYNTETLNTESVSFLMGDASRYD